MSLNVKELWQKKRALLAGAAATLLMLTNQAVEAEAAMQVPESIYQWVQSSPRMNYFFNKSVIHYEVDKKGDINLDVIVVPVLKSFDDTQIQDVIQKRRWKMLDVEPYEFLAGQAEYVRYNTRLKLVYVDKVIVLDRWMGIIEENKTGQTLDLAKLTEKHLERQFYEGMLKYVTEHQDEVVAMTKGKLKPEDAIRLEKERKAREKAAKRNKKK